jgi:hypothetical protein
LKRFDNKELRTFGPKRNELTGNYRKVGKELHNSHASSNSIRVAG